MNRHNAPISRTKTIRALLCLGTIGATLAALSPSVALASPPPPASAAKPDTRPPKLNIHLGYRSTFVVDGGYDYFSDKNALGQGTFGATYAVFERGQFALSTGFSFQSGGASSNLRAQGTKLVAQRLGIPLEARYSVVPWFGVMGSITPLANRALARVSDASGALETDAWTFGLDVSAGGTVWIPTGIAPLGRTARVGLQLLGGYAWTAPVSLHLYTSTNQASMDLGPLKLRGPFVHVALVGSL